MPSQGWTLTMGSTRTDGTIFPSLTIEGNPMARRPRKDGVSGYQYVRKEKNRHGTEFFRFRWKGKIQYVFDAKDEPYDSEPFKEQHRLLMVKVDALKKGIPVDGISVDFGLPRAKPETFRWLCEQ